MRNLKMNTKGITLVSLVVTIIVLLILASIATYSGINVINSSKLTAFTTELKIMQTQVNEQYQRYKDGDNTVLDLGEDLDKVSEQANKVFTEDESGITDQNGYRYFDQNTIKNVLKIEGVEGKFFVNIQTRSVVSYEGFKYEGETYYTLDQLPDGLYNVEYEDKNANANKPTFNVSYETLENDKYKIKISNIAFDGYISKWSVRYKKEDDTTWYTSKELSFYVANEGTYNIKIENEGVESEEKFLQIKSINSRISPEVQRLLDKGITIDIKDINWDSSRIQKEQIPLISTNSFSSSIYSSQYDVDKAFDSNDSTYWCTENGKANDAYIGYDFKEKIKLSFLSFYTKEGHRCKDIKLQCSDDNSEWIDASEVITLENVDRENIIVNTKINEAYQYWRIYIISSYSSRYSIVSEIKFYNCTQTIYPKINNASDQVVRFLIDADATLEFEDIIIRSVFRLMNPLVNNENVISSSIYGSGYDAYMAFDNNNSTYWCTKAGKQDDAYIGYNFNKNTYVYFLDVYSERFKCKEVKLQCSNDNSEWMDASDVITLPDDSNIHTIESNIKDKAYKYWRLYIVTGYDSNYTGVYELDFYGI